MSAFRGSYSDWKLIKTRGIIQIVVEIPLSDADTAYEILGGMPDPAHERWVAVAAISADAAQPRQNEAVTKRTAGAKPWRELSPAQQAGIRSEDIIFAHFLEEERKDDWHEAQSDPAECVRLICGVESRADLTTNHKARVMWKALNDQFEAWKALEHA